MKRHIFALTPLWLVGLCCLAGSALAATGFGLDVLSNIATDCRIRASNTDDIVFPVSTQWQERPEDELIFTTHTGTVFQRVCARLFLSWRGLDVGPSFGHFGSSLHNDYGDLSIGSMTSLLLELRYRAGPFWSGFGVGKYYIHGKDDLDDLLESLRREGSDGGIRDLYLGLTIGGRIPLWQYGALALDLSYGSQRLGDDADGNSVSLRVTSFSAGYSIRFDRPTWSTKRSGRFIEAVSSVLSDSLPYAFGLTFVRVPSGLYYVGTPEGEHGRDTELEFRPRPVPVDGFLISTTEVTQQAYKAVIRREWSSYSGAWTAAHSVTFDEAVAYCESLSARDPHFVYSLPTESEWEVACRAMSHPAEGPVAGAKDDQERFRKDEASGCLAMQKYAWFMENRRKGGPEHVARKMPNQIGLYDTHGNVAEWCMSDPRIPDPGPVSLGRRPLRGGSITSTYPRCRAGSRAMEPKDARRSSIGFRVVCRPSAPTGTS